MLRSLPWAFALALVATGCSSTPSITDFYCPPPKLTLDHRTIQDELIRHESTTHDRELARPKSALPIGEVGETAAAIDAAFRSGDRAAGLALAERHASVYTWERATAAVTIDCRYESKPGDAGGVIALVLTRRPDVTGPVAIAFPPGTYATPVAQGESGWVDPESEARYSTWPKAQDLGFLEAPVIVLPSGESKARIEVPIACASFGNGPPRSHQLYELRQFEPGSPIDKLLVAVCATPEPSETATQLAVWLARNDISWPEFRNRTFEHGGLGTFGSRQCVMPADAEGASRLLLEADLDPRRSRFFDGAGWTATAEPTAPNDGLGQRIAPARSQAKQIREAPTPTTEPNPLELP